MVSETGTEDWGEEPPKNESGNDGNWSTVDQKEESSPQVGSAEAQEEEAVTPTTTSPAGRGTSPGKAPSGSSGGGGERKETTVFSLSRGNDLVTRYTSKRGKVRGRGQRSGGGTSRVGSEGLSSRSSNSTPSSDKTRHAPPKPGSGGITVIEPLEKRLQKQQEERNEKQDASNQQQSPSEGAPSSKANQSGTAKETTKNRPSSGGSSSIRDGSAGSHPATSKPKRYSSQRQKGLLCFLSNSICRCGLYIVMYLYVVCSLTVLVL